jgi:hypothetical protein
MIIMTGGVGMMGTLFAINRVRPRKLSAEKQIEILRRVDDVCETTTGQTAVDEFNRSA